MQRHWICTIHHVYRQVDRAADHLAEIGSTLSWGMLLFPGPPASIINILSDDCTNVYRTWSVIL